jgi:hypothetical protein
MPYCPNCGADVAPSTNFCTECGGDVADVGVTDAGGTQQPSTDTQQQRTRPDQSRSSRRNEPSQPSPTSGGQEPGRHSDGVSRRTLLAATGVALGAGLIVSQGDGATNALTGGGNTTPPLDQMEVRFVDVRKPDIGMTSATIPLIVAFHNPTDRTIPDISGDFDIYLDDTRVGSEELTVNELDPGEETKVNLDVIIEYADYGEALVDALRSGSYTIEIRGSLEAGSASRSFQVTAGS